jgi:hypothetical protein
MLRCLASASHKPSFNLLIRAGNIPARQGRERKASQPMSAARANQQKGRFSAMANRSAHEDISKLADRLSYESRSLLATPNQPR